MDVPPFQTIQLNADGPLDIPIELAAAIRRARIGGITRLLDGDFVIAEIVPSGKRLNPDGTWQLLTNAEYEEALRLPLTEAQRTVIARKAQDQLYSDLAKYMGITPEQARTFTRNMQLADAAHQAANEQVLGRPNFRTALEGLINDYSREHLSNTPNYLLANFLENCLKAFEEAVRYRDRWYRTSAEEDFAETATEEGNNVGNPPNDE